MVNLQQQFDEKARRLKIANLRAEVLRLALRKMLEAGATGRTEASGIGRKKFLERMLQIGARTSPLFVYRPSIFHEC
jgi:hypothetical protein